VTYYAILHKPTGCYLPLSRGGGKRGFTYAQPDGDRPPRLFTRKQAATLALKWWLGGPAIVRWYEDGLVLEGQKPDPTRKADEMEIVAVKITPTPTEA